MRKQIKKIPRSKRFSGLISKVNKNQTYSIEEAIQLAKDTSTTKFDGSIELAVRTGIDTKKSDQQIRSTALLPHGTGKKLKITVIAPADKQKEAKEAGADVVGGEEIIEQIAKTKKIDFDILLTVPEMMKDLAKIAKILGPKGLMPNPKTETVTPNLKKAVTELAKGKISFKNDDTGNIHISIGKASFDNQKLLENYQTFMDTLQKLKPAGLKGVYIKNISLSSTMGPGIKVTL